MALDCYPVAGGSTVPCDGDVELWVERICALLPPGFGLEAAGIEGTLIHSRVRALAHIFDAFHKEACALPPEFRCDTADRTLVSWQADYGIPDECGINDLCTKVIASGDGTCASMQSLVDNIALTDPSMALDLCCEAIPPEMQCGQCWDMGNDQMPPQPVWDRGGSELGFASMGFCPPDDDCGSDLGVDMLGSDDDDCNIVGYCDPGEVVATVELPCEPDGCKPWRFTGTETFLIGCPAPYELNYTGTAYHLKLGIEGSSAILSDPGYSQMGCMEMGCSELCTPPVAEILCFMSRYRHAHIKIVPVYC